MASNFSYRTEDKMAQWVLQKALECYLQAHPFDLSPIEVHVIQTEIVKLSKLSEARLDASRKISRNVPSIS